MSIERAWPRRFIAPGPERRTTPCAHCSTTVRGHVASWSARVRSDGAEPRARTPGVQRLGRGLARRRVLARAPSRGRVRLAAPARELGGSAKRSRPGRHAAARGPQCPTRHLDRGAAPAGARRSADPAVPLAPDAGGALDDVGAARRRLPAADLLLGREPEGGPDPLDLPVMLGGAHLDRLRSSRCPLRGNALHMLCRITDAAPRMKLAAVRSHGAGRQPGGGKPAYARAGSIP